MVGFRKIPSSLTRRNRNDMTLTMLVYVLHFKPFFIGGRRLEHRVSVLIRHAHRDTSFAVTNPQQIHRNAERGAGNATRCHRIVCDRHNIRALATQVH